MQKQKKVFIYVLILQLFVIFYLIYSIYTKYAATSISVIPLDENTIDISPTAHLRYFFEPKSNTIITDQYYQYVSLSTAPRYTINKDTLNERFNYSIQKSENTYRIITLGDSFTYGQYMNTADNWPEVLEKELQACSSDTRFEVINLAVPDYDIQYSIERFKKRGLKYHPNFVVWFLKNDDFAQINEITYPIKMKYLEKMKRNGTLEKSIKEGEYFPYTKKVMKEFEEKYGKEQILSKQLTFLHSISQYYKGSLLLVSPKTTYAYNKAIMTEFADERKNTYTYLDLSDFSILPDHHPSREGQKQIAEKISTYLLNKKIIPCKNNL